MGLVCSPSPYKWARSEGRDEVSWRYWSLKTRKVELGSDGLGVELKRTSPVEFLMTEKPKGVVRRREKMRSELGWVRRMVVWVGDVG